MNTIEVWGTTYTIGNYPAEVMITIQGETAMFDTTDALTEIIKGYTNFPTRREVSPFFPFASVADVQAANRLTRNYFFDRRDMQVSGTKIESELYAGVLFITSEDSDGEGRHYTVHYVVPTGAIFALEGASQIDSINQARDIAHTVAKALRESDLLFK